MAKYINKEFGLLESSMVSSKLSPLPDGVKVISWYSYDTNKLETYKQTTVSINVSIKRVKGTTNDLVAVFTPSTRNHLDHFTYEWWYWVPNISKGILDSTGDIKANPVVNTATYSMPDTAVKVEFRIVAVSTKKTVRTLPNRSYIQFSKKYRSKEKWIKAGIKKMSFPYWVSKVGKASFTRPPDDPEFNKPTTPPVPTLDLDKNKLTVSVNNLDSTATEVTFDVVKNDSVHVTQKSVLVRTTAARLVVTVAHGNRYKARCKINKTNSSNYASDWSNYSDNTEVVIPAPVKTVNKPVARSSNSVSLSWTASRGAGSYEVEYADSLSKFDSGGTHTETTENTNILLEGLETGHVYYFRVRAVSSADSSYKTAWTPANIKKAASPPSITLGVAPGPPTTYSITNTIKVGDKTRLYWVHNAQDGSTQVAGQVQLVFHTGSGTITDTVTVNNPNYNNDYLKDENLYFELDTSRDYTTQSGTTISFREGMYVEWKVRTKGITNQYGGWSVVRRLDIFGVPYIELSTNTTDGTMFSYPLELTLNAGPQTQNVISYYIEIIAANTYTTIDRVGEPVVVSEGDTIYSSYFVSDEYSVARALTPSDVVLEDDQNYTINATVTMSSGISADPSTTEIITNFEDFEAVPSATVYLNEETISATIIPFCLDDLVTPDEEEEEEVEDLEPADGYVLGYISSVGEEYSLTWLTDINYVYLEPDENSYYILGASDSSNTHEIGETYRWDDTEQTYISYFGAYDWDTIGVFPNTNYDASYHIAVRSASMFTDVGYNTIEPVSGVIYLAISDFGDFSAGDMFVWNDVYNYYMTLEEYEEDGGYDVDPSERIPDIDPPSEPVDPVEPDDDEEEDDDGDSIVYTENVTLSVYRRAVDGEFIEIATEVPNDGVTSVVDPHPNFGYVTYRVVATNTVTGEMVHADLAPLLLDVPGIVITWDESTDTNVVREGEDENSSTYSENEVALGRMLFLPYNMDVSENHSIDKSMINYIGRKRPVGYYGTQLGETATWKAEFIKNHDLYDRDYELEDENVLALVRELAVYPGDVYVRESNGTGYWASIDINFDLNHTAVTVPVTFTITRVEGGA